MAPVYHLELRAFPHVARAFNLDRATLESRFVKPWAAGEVVDYQDHRFLPDKTRLTILEDPESFVPRSGLGLGRGWGEATRRSQEVTEAVIAAIHRGADARPEVEALTEALVEVAAEPIRLADALALAAASHPGWRASEQLGLAEQAVWEALHREQLVMQDDAGSVSVDGWQAVVLSWPAWTGADRASIRLRRP